MAAVIIRKKDVDRLGKELLSEMFNFLHDEYILTEFEEMKEVQKEFLENLVLNHIDSLHRQNQFLEKKDTNYSKLVIDAMKNDGIDTEGIYLTVKNLKLDMEIDEDLYFKTKAFIDIFKVFESAYTYLED